MTFDEYIQNPMGKKNQVFSQRGMFRDLYQSKLDKILVREMGKIEYKLYTDSKNDKYYIHMKVPSEVIQKFYYDVVIEFSSEDEPIAKGIQSLNTYKVRFFSNDPSFVFTFCHAFIKNDMFIKELSPRMSNEALKKVAVERNPNEEVGYVKSIFFAYLIMKQRGLFNKILFQGVQSFNLPFMLNNIMHADKKIALRQQAQKELNAKLHNEKQLAQNKDKSTQTLTDKAAKRIGKIPIVKKVEAIKTATNKKSSTIKTTRKK